MLFGWGSSGGYDHAITMVTPATTVVFPKQNSTIDPGRLQGATRYVTAYLQTRVSRVRKVAGSMAMSIAVALGFELMVILQFWRLLVIWLKAATVQSYPTAKKSLVFVF